MLAETKLGDEGQITEISLGYTFFLEREAPQKVVHVELNLLQKPSY